ncbi:hypothetical protein [Nocardia sp. NPDC004722]
MTTTGLLVVVPSTNFDLSTVSLESVDSVLRWATAGVGWIGQRASISISLSDKGKGPVEVTGLHLVDVTYSDPATGTALEYNPLTDNDGMAPVGLRADFDSTTGHPDSVTLGRWQTDQDPSSAGYLSSTPIGPYPANEPDVVLRSWSDRMDIEVTAQKRAAVSFRLRIDTTVDGQPRQPLLLDTYGGTGSGQPFRITPVCSGDGHPVRYARGLIASPLQATTAMADGHLDGSRSLVGDGPRVCVLTGS